MDRRRLIQHGLAGVAALAAPRGGLLADPESVTASVARALAALSADRPYLETAVRAAHWLERTAQRSRDGVFWSADPDRPAEVGYDLYNGTTGVLPFWVELHAATGEPRALAMVQGAADHLVRALANVNPADAGLYTGVAGMAWALGLAQAATGDVAHGTAARRALAMVHAAARQEANGPGGAMTARWMDSTDVISGRAGTGFALLWAHRALGDAASLGLARAAGMALLTDGLPGPQPGQLRWTVNATIPREYPNFSHGTAGVATFLAQLHAATGEAAFLDGALAGARYLAAIATPTAGDGRMVHHSTPGNEGLFYMSWCHGPAGTARLFHTLARVTGDASHTAMADRLARATVAMRVPERSPGFWSNVGQCCGNCGVSEYFVARHERYGDAGALAFAERVARDAIARGVRDAEGMKWVQAENRTSPDAVVAQTGLMQGAAGVGLAMLHLDGAIAGRARRVVVPDAGVV